MVNMLKELIQINVWLLQIFAKLVSVDNDLENRIENVNLTNGNPQVLMVSSYQTQFNQF